MNKYPELRVPFFTILFFFLCLFIYTKLAGPIALMRDSNLDLFMVDAAAEVTAVPSTAFISLGVTNTDSDEKIVKNNLDTRIDKVISELKKIGIEEKDITTTNYSIYPNYGKSTPPVRPMMPTVEAPSNDISGYTATANIEVESKDVEKVEKAIDTAVANGANVVGGLSFILDEETREKAKDEARKKAVVKAKEKAKRIAKETGMRLRKIVNVQEYDAGLPYQYNATKSSESPIPAPDMATELNPGETNVSVTVTLHYETY